MIAAVLLAAAFAPAAADIVHLKGGRSLRLRDCHRAGDELRCATSSGTVGLPIDQVESLEREPAQPPPAARPSPSPPSPSPQGPSRAADEPLPPSLEASFPSAAPPSPEAARARIAGIGAAMEKPGGDTPAARHERAVLRAWLGNAAMLSHDYEGAVPLYQSSLEDEPRLDVARLNLCTALINLNRLEEAGDRLRALQAEQPGSARVLELLGEVDARDGRLAEAAEVWERSLAIKPSDSLRGRLDRIRRLMQAEEGFRRTDGAHFSMKFDGEKASPGLAQEILGYLEEEYGTLAGRFSHWPGGTIRVTLYSQKAFLEATASPDWVGGLFDGEIRMPIGGVSSLTPQVRRVLAHELTHCFVASKSAGNAPQWIQEGIAQVVEGKSAASSRESLRQAWGVLGGVDGAAEFSYPRALSQVEFFLRTWSGAQLNDLLDHLGRGNDIDAAMRAVTGLSYREFLAAWGDSLAG